MLVRVFGVVDTWFIPSVDAGCYSAVSGMTWLIAQADQAVLRGPGGYLSWIKLGIIWILLLCWISFLEWVNKDSQRHDLQHFVWNPAVFFPFFVALFLAIKIPLFAVGGSLLALSWLVPAIIYVVQRNSQLPPHLKVLTGEHLWYVTATSLNKMGMKLQVETREMHERGPAVVFHALGGANEQENQSNLIRARQSEGFLHAKELLADAYGRRVDKVMLDYGAEKVDVRYQIDGVWHEADSQEKEPGELMLTVLKLLANLKPDQRRIRQEGVFRADFDNKKIMTRIVTQGTKTGERVLWHLARPTETLKTLTDVGMRDKMQEQITEVLRQDSGIIVFCSLPSGGLSTGMSAALRTTDRFMNDFVAIYEKEEDELPVDNISVERYDKSTGPKPDKFLLSIMRKDPDAIVMPVIPDVETVTMMCQAAKNGKLVITSVRAKDAIEALLRVLLLKVPAEEFVPVVKAVLNQRLVRKLCEACKVSYKPSPELLKKLGLPVGRVDAFFKPPERTEETRNEEVCKECDGIGYLGRTAAFELLIVTPELQEALLNQPKLEVLRQVARQGKHRSLQEEGILLVARGITSLAELQRALKE